MKDNKGITLANLVVYVVGFTIIIGIVTVIISFINTNIVQMNEATDRVAEYSKFNLAFVEEVKKLNNEVTNVTSNSIEFSSGNKYTFQDNKIYLNKIALVNHVKKCTFELINIDYKQVVAVNMEIGKGTTITRNVRYVLTE